MLQNSTLSTLQVTEEELSSDLPPDVTSQPISKIFGSVVVQVAEAGSPNLTTSSAGVNTKGQPAIQKQTYSIRASFRGTINERFSTVSESSHTNLLF